MVYRVYRLYFTQFKNNLKEEAKKIKSHKYCLSLQKKIDIYLLLLC